jgi:hypothetical protein
MNERLKELALRAGFETNGAIYTVGNYQNGHEYFWAEDFIEDELKKFAELILANADELKRMMNTDPINKPFELNPKFVAKCDEIGRSRRQFQ